MSKSYIRQQGALFDFQIDIAVHGKEIVIGHTHTRNPAHENALRDAFRAARRQLQDYERMRRQEVKRHARLRKSTDPRWGRSTPLCYDSICQ